MATSKQFNEWFDKGIDVTPLEIEEYELASEIEDAFANILDIYRTINTYSGLPYGLQNWARGALRDCKRLMFALCVACEVARPSEEIWETPEELKQAFRAKVGRINLWDYTNEMMTDVETSLRRSVTMGRLQSYSWSKSVKSRSNKFCNFLLNERNTMDRWETQILSYQGPEARMAYDELHGSGS